MSIFRKQIIVFVCLGLFSLSLLAVTPQPALAQSNGGLVPCGIGNDKASQCDFCYLIQLFQNVVRFIIVDLAAPIATLMFAWAGIRMMVNATDSGERSTAKKMLTDVVVGFILILLAWQIVLLIINTLVKSETIPGAAGGSWFVVSCARESGTLLTEMNPLSYNNPIATVPASLDPSVGMTPADMASKIVATSKFNTAIDQAASSAQVDPTLLKAFVTVESSGNPNAVSPANAYGLGQLTLATARSLDPTGTSGLSDEALKNKLLSNTDYNLQLSAKNLNAAISSCKGDITCASAYYNGGPAAIKPSRDCDGGLLAYQCPYDSRVNGQSCYNTNVSGCKVNTGFAETRQYTVKINAVKQAISGK